ncbi:hypothetical protein GCM10023257_44960 [Streptomyces hyderabadensis]|uniref:Transposase n=1 Tax=Streptomyces hyderabadensis TaxID=598549 RepID=A0ABP9IG37_9ACTN
MIGYSFVHSAIDDYSRLAHSEVLTNEPKETAAAFGGARTPSSPSTASPSNAA